MENKQGRGVGDYLKKAKGMSDEYLTVPLLEYESVELNTDLKLKYSPTEQLRARENEAFGMVLAQGLLDLVADEVSEEGIGRIESQIAIRCNPQQAKHAQVIVGDIRDRFEKAKIAEEDSLISSAVDTFENHFALSAPPSDVIEWQCTSLGAVKIIVHDLDAWHVIYESTGGGPSGADSVLGFVLVDNKKEDQERFDFLKGLGNLIFLNQANGRDDHSDTEKHETFHWLYQQVLSQYERPRYESKQEADLFLRAKNEILAYALGGSWVSDLGSIVNSLDVKGEMRRLKDRTILERMQKSLNDQVSGALDSGQDIMDAAIDKGESAGRESVTALVACLRELARLGVHGDRDLVDFSLPAIIGSQSFKELAFNLSKFDTQKVYYEADKEFQDVDPGAVDLQRAENIIYPGLEFGIPIKGLNVLMDKLNIRVKQIEIVKDKSSEEKDALRRIESLISFHEAYTS
jgi:hypothetical protein